MINFRVVVFAFVSLCAGSLLSPGIFLGKPLEIFLFCVLVLFAIVGIFLPHKKKASGRDEKIRESHSAKRVVAFCASLIFLFIGVFSCAISSFLWNDNSFMPGEMQIEGTILETSKTEKGSWVIIDNVVLDGKRQTKNLSLFVLGASESDFTVGFRIELNEYVTAADVFENGVFQSFNHVNNIAFEAFAETIPNTTFAAPPLHIRIRSAVKDALFMALGSNNGAIAYAMIFGEKEFVSESTYGVFTLIGTGHVLAVSGLHIGFLVVFLMWVLSFFGISFRKKAIITSFVLLGFCILCGFTPSVTRATIMAIFLMFSTIVGRRRDSLTAVSVAGLIILASNPLAIFGVGFQLSFAAVFAILLLSPAIENFLSKWLPQKISAAISVATAAQIGTFAIILNTFNNINIFSIFANLVIIPLFGIVFMAILPLAFLATLFPFFSFFLSLASFGIDAIVFVSNIFAATSISIFMQSVGLISFIITIIFCIIFSDKLNTSAKGKLAIMLSCVVFLISTNAVIIALPSPIKNSCVWAVSTPSSQTIWLVGCNNERVLIGCPKTWADENSCLSLLNNVGCGKVSAIVLTNTNTEISNDFWSQIGRPQIINATSETSVENFSGLKISVLEINNKIAGTVATCEKYSLFVPSKNISESQFELACEVNDFSIIDGTHTQHTSNATIFLEEITSTNAFYDNRVWFLQ